MGRHLRFHSTASGPEDWYVSEQARRGSRLLRRRRGLARVAQILIHCSPLSATLGTGASIVSSKRRVGRTSPFCSPDESANTQRMIEGIHASAASGQPFEVA